MRQFKTVLLNDFQICSLISGVGYRYTYRKKNIKAVLECNRPLPVCVACRMSADMLLINDYVKETYKD